MRELSLFSGAGGGLLASKLLGWRTIGYVEYNDYCQRVIRQRIDDGILDDAPIFGDIRAFIRDGYAAAYQGMVDVVSGGFPCQPFSIAGKRAGADDPRNMWPATIATIRAIRPRFAFLENVPALLNSGYFGTIVVDLAESGYSVRWRRLSGAELGAPHKRDRLWIVAYSENVRTERGPWSKAEDTRATRRWGLVPRGSDRISYGEDAADAQHAGRDGSAGQCEVASMEQQPGRAQEQESLEQPTGSSTRRILSAHVAFAHSDRLAGRANQQEPGCKCQRETDAGAPSQDLAYAEGQPKRAGLCEDEQAGQWRRRSSNGCSTRTWWSVEP